MVAAMVTVLILGVPASSGAAVAQNLKAPYGSATSHSILRLNHSGCAQGAIGNTTFSVTSGLGAFSARGFAATCTKALGGKAVDSAVIATGLTVLSVPINSPSVGIVPVSILVNATFRGNASSNFSIDWNCPRAHWNRHTGATSSNCQAFGFETLDLQAVLMDRTNITQVQPNNVVVGFSQYTEVYSDDNCFSYGCAWSNYSYSYSTGALSGNFSWWFNTTLSSAAVYAIGLTVQGTVSVNVQGFPDSHVQEALNYGTRGNGWNLTSITVR
jgi:hypothetical protein